MSNATPSYGISGKVAIVTGAASGIGEASARRLAAEGAKLCLVDLDREGLDRLVAELGANAVAAVADVSNEVGARHYVNVALSAFGRIDLLHSNAGIVGPPGPIHEATAKGFDDVFSVNVRGTVLAIAATVPEMLKQGGGAIVITASVAGQRPAPGIGIYAASKIALVALAKTAAVELGPQNIRVNAIAPGITDTPAFRATALLAGSDGGAIFDKILLPLERIGTPAEVAALSTWLLSDQASYVTGGLYHVDGGNGA